jgi:hypothetical protein
LLLKDSLLIENSKRFHDRFSSICLESNELEKLIHPIKWNRVFFELATGTEAFLPPSPSKSWEVLVVFGVCKGEAFYTYQDWLKEDSRHHLVFVDSSVEAFYEFVSDSKSREVFENLQVYCLSCDTPQAIAKQLKHLYPFSNLNIILWALQEKEDFKNLHQQALEVFHEHLKFQEVFKDFFSGSYLFYKNFLNHLGSSSFPISLDSLKNKFKGVPAVICGAGPSITSEASYLKEFQNKGLIIGCGSSVLALQALGINPHICASIDPNLEQKKRYDKFWKVETPLIYNSRTHFGVVDKMQGIRLGIGNASAYPLANWIIDNGEESILEEGSGVVIWATKLSLLMGCNPIIFSGLDLAFSKEQLYASTILDSPLDNGVNYCNFKNHDGLPILVKDEEGKDIYTQWKWIEEAKTLGEIAACSNKEFINATAMGIPIPGVKRSGWEQVLNKNIFQKNIEDMLFVQMSNISTKTPSTKIIEKLKLLHKELKKLCEVVSKAEQLCLEEPSFLNQCEIEELELKLESSYVYHMWLQIAHMSIKSSKELSRKNLSFLRKKGILSKQEFKQHINKIHSSIFIYLKELMERKEHLVLKTLIRMKKEF